MNNIIKSGRMGSLDVRTKVYVGTISSFVRTSIRFRAVTHFDEIFSKISSH